MDFIFNDHVDLAAFLNTNRRRNKRRDTTTNLEDKSIITRRIQLSPTIFPISAGASDFQVASVPGIAIKSPLYWIVGI